MRAALLENWALGAQKTPDREFPSHHLHHCAAVQRGEKAVACQLVSTATRRDAASLDRLFVLSSDAAKQFDLRFFALR